MKPVADARGVVIEGMVRNSNGSLTLNNHDAYKKSKLQHDKFSSLTQEVDLLKEQMKMILEKLNG